MISLSSSSFSKWMTLLGLTLFFPTATVYGQEYPQLGVNDLSGLSYSYEASVDADCMYTLGIEFKHNDAFPMGDAIGDVAEKCLPGVMAPEDDLPYQAGRWYWERLPEYIRTATGFDHPSIDWNPCGHPGPGWLTGHYDVHFYTVAPEFRATEMMCDVIPGTPVCDGQTQATAKGQRFLNLPALTATDEFANAPPGFVFFLADAVMHMGVHGFSPMVTPNTTNAWADPSTIMVCYDSNMICFEPMIPLSFMSGTDDHFYEEDVTYVEQSIMTLPSYYSAEYKADTGIVHVTMKGKSNTCMADFDTAKTAFEATDPDSSTDGTGSVDDTSSATTYTTTITAVVAGLMVGWCVSLLSL